MIRLRRLVRAIAACLRRPAPKPATLIEALEPRLLLSAELGLGLDAPRDLADDSGQPLADGAGLASITAMDVADSSSPNALELDALAAMAGEEPDATAKHELVFVDTGVEDYAAIVDDLRARKDGTELTVIMLDGAQDGIEQIDDALAGTRDVDALHIISHGTSTGVQLGSTWLTADNLDDYAEVVAGWSDAFSADGDLLLYGCNLAADAGGRGLLDSLAELTGTDVAASEDLTGQATLGGDWDLEYRVGAVESSVAVSADAQHSFAGVLGQITVTTTADVLDGDADTASLAALAINPGADGEISLREAVIAANTDIGADSIFLDAGTYGITRVELDDSGGDFDIRDSLSIVGLSPATSAVSGNNFSSVFDVHDDAAITVSLSNLAIQSGFTNVIAGEDGAGLYIEGSANTPEVYLNNVWFSGNNTAGLDDDGGAIYNAGDLTIDSALIENNTSERGAGIYNAAGATLTMTNVTVSGNTATAGEGGGLYNAGTATLRHVTIASNDADEGGGIYVAGGSVDIANSIIAGNTAGSGSNDFFGAIASSGSNIIGDDTGTSGSFDVSDQRNVDPLLGALADNGGALMTHAPAAVEAIDTADPLLSNAVDQRGFLRDDGSADIGAHEVGASAAPVDLTLYLSTDQAVAGGGQPGAGDWQAEDLISIGAPELNLGPGTTSGTFSVPFDLDGFAPGTNTNAAHLVTKNIQIGASGFQLLAGDLLLSPDSIGAYTSNNTTPLDAGFSASVSAQSEDLVVFRPDAAGDYSTGAFGLLLEDVSGSGSVRGITLIEQTTVVGGTTLQAGDFLYSRSGGAEDHDVWIYETGTTGAGSTPDARVVLLAGDDAQVGIQEQIHGIDLLEEAATIGGQTFAAGTLLVNVDSAEAVGANGLNVDEHDVFALDVAQSTEAGGVGIATASTLFDGSQIGFDSAAEDLDVVMLGASRDDVSGQLWFSTADTVSSHAGDAGSVASWQDQEVVELSGPGFALEPGTTVGTFSAVFDLATFASDTDLDALHYVTSDSITVGTGTTFALQKGDVLFSIGEDGKTFTSSNVLSDVNKEDVVVFRPDNAGDYSSGTFSLLLENPSGEDIKGISLVESDTLIGDHTVTRGSFLYSDVAGTGTGANDVKVYLPGNVGVGTTSGGTVQTLIDGDELNGASNKIIGDAITGIELIETAVDLGGTRLTSGSILLSMEGDGMSLGDNSQVVDNQDIALLTVGKTTLVNGTTESTAALLLEGNDIGLDALGEEFDSIAMVSAPAAAPNVSPISVAGMDQTIAEGDDLTVSGAGSSDADGTIVTYEWDLRNDGSFEAAGMDAIFTWAGLSGAGINDDGVFDVALRVTDDQGAQHTDVFTLSVNNVAPTLTAVGAATVDAGSIYTLDLMVSDPGDDAISTYTINWGDGTITTAAFTGPTTGVTHTYTDPGFTRNITFSAEDEDGSWTASDLIVGNWIAGDDKVFSFDGSTGDPDGLFGSSGGDLDRGYTPVVGPDGNYYVAGYDSNTIVRYDANGNYMGVFVASGPLAPGVALSKPTGLAWGPDGNLYVGNDVDDNILRFDASGAFIDEFGTAGAHLSGPTGLAFGPDGDLYVASYDNDKLVRFDGTNGGTPELILSTGLSNPEQIVFDGAGDLYIASGGNDEVVRWDGSSLTTYFTDPNLEFPTGVTFGPDGQLYVSSYDNDRIFRYDGSTSQEFVNDGAGGLDQPTFLTFSPAHQVLVNANADPVFVGSGPFAIDENAVAGTVVGDVDANDGDGADPGLGGLIFSEIMYDPAGTEPEWEWVELYNRGSEAVDLTGFVFDDNDTQVLGGANIASGTINAGETAVLYNADSVSAGNFTAVWGPGANLIAVSEWDDILLANAGDTLGLWQSFADYSGDHQTHANAIMTLTYDDNAPWPVEDGFGSIYLTDLDADPTDGSNWALSTVGSASPLGGTAYRSTAAAGNSGLDVGTPGDPGPGSGLTYSIISNENPDSDGQLAFTIDTDTGVITVNDAGDLDFEGTNPLTITVQADDGVKQSTTVVTINLNDLNEQLGASNVDQTQTYTEGDASVALDDIVVIDVDTGETVTATLTLADINAGSLSTSGAATYTAGTGVWTITDTIANVNAALANVAFMPAAEYDQDTTIAVNIADGGEDGTVAVTGTINLDVTPVNDQPGATVVNQTQFYTEGDASVALDDIVVTDVDSAETITATLTLADINAGSLTTSGTATYAAGTGVWTITDTVVNVNAALANVAFMPATEYDQDTTIAVNIADGGENGTVAVTGTINLDVTPVNDQPGATVVNQTQFYTEGDASVALGDIVVSDADVGEIVTATLTLADTSAGSLTTSGTATYTAGTGVWTITDTVVNVNAALTSVAFIPATEYDQDTTIAVNIVDGGEDGTVAVTGTINLDVTPVNDQPGATVVNQTQFYTEGDASVALDDIVVTDVDSAETITATLTLADINAGSLTTSGTATYAAGTGVWTITDTVVNVNAALANVAFMPATEYDQDTSIAVNIADGGEDGTVVVTGTVNLDVTPVNDQPGATVVNQTQFYTEGDASVALDDIVVNDADVGEIVTATLTLADTSAGSLTTSGTATYTAGTGIWTLTDTVANVNAALANVAFMPVTEYEQDTTIAVNIADGGEDGTVAVTGTINLDVTPVNDQPGATVVNQTQFYTEGDVSVALDDIVVTDVDSAETITATLTLADINAGSLTTSGMATYTAGTGVWTITDTVVNVNAALANVAFMPATEYDQDTTIAVNIADGGEDGTVAVTGTINLDVTPVNDQPGATLVNQTQTYTEGDASVALDDIVVTDVDSAETITATLTLADINAGSLTTSGTATYTAGTGIWTITDTVANVNAALANVAFMPAMEYDQDTTIAVNIADGGEDGTVAVTGTINLDVTLINDQPGATLVNQTQTYTEGDASVALDDIAVSDADVGEIVTATLTLADTSAGSLTTSGTATYTAGTGVWTVTDTVANVNAALANVAFMPATEYDQDTTIAVNIADGGEDGTVAVTGTINLDVTPVNDQLAATNVNQTHAYTEDAAAVALDNIVVTDIDTGEIVTAILTQSDARAGTLTTSGTATYDPGAGVWTITDTVANVNAALASVEFVPAADYDQDTTLAVTVMDGSEDGRVAVNGTINLDVTAINDAPIAHPGGPYSVIEGTTTTLNGAASSDVDSGGVRYEWDLDYDGTSFNVDATGVSPTFDASGIDGPDSRTVALRVTDDAIDLTLAEGSTWAATAGWTAEGFDEVWFARARNFASGGGFELGVGTEPPVAFPDSADHAWSGSGSVDTVTVGYVAGTNTASITVGGTTAEFAVGGQFTDLYIQVRATGPANAIVVSNMTLDMGSGDVLNGTAGTVSAVGTAGTDVHYIGVHNLNAYLSDGFTFSADVLPTFGGGLSAEQIALDVIVANDSGFAPGGGARSAIVTTTVDVTDSAVRVPTPAGEPAPDAEPDPDPPSAEEVAPTESFASENSSDPTSDEPGPEIEPPASEDSAPGGEAASDDPSEPDTAEQAAMFADVLPSPIDLDELTAVTEQIPTPVEALMIAADNERTTSLPAAFTERMLFSFFAGLLPGQPMVSADLSYLSQYGSEDDRAQLIGALVTDTGFLDELDLAREDINEVASINHAFVGSTVALSTGISVGYVVWLARGGLLLASMLSSMPAWRLVDPLPILASLREQDTEDAGDSLASLLEQAATDEAPAQDADAPVLAPIVETDLNGPPDQAV